MLRVNPINPTVETTSLETPSHAETSNEEQQRSQPMLHVILPFRGNSELFKIVKEIPHQSNRENSSTASIDEVQLIVRSQSVSFIQ